jgi:pimeloyl-ACP methyl ester carboxylesterase
MLQFIEVGNGDNTRKIAVEAREGSGPPLVWLGGFRSDMRGSKAEILDEWAAAQGRACIRFDYSGHGESGGRFEDGTISRWCEEAVAVIEKFARERPILIGSSMGGWIALLATRHLRENNPALAPAGIVLVAPAADFTERLMWAEFDESIRATIMNEGVFIKPSLYSDEGYPITRALIEDGRNNLLLDDAIVTDCPVHILQGMQDPDVPWRHALETMERMPSDNVVMTLVKDGDHRLSRPEDLDRLVAAVDRISRDITATAGGETS